MRPLFRPPAAGAGRPPCPPPAGRPAGRPAATLIQGAAAQYRVAERAPATFTFQAADGTTYEIPVRTAAEAGQIFRIAQDVMGRFPDDDGGPDGYATVQGSAAAGAAAAGAACGEECGSRAAQGDIGLAIDIMVAEGVPRENIVREPWITLSPRRLGWRDAMGRSPARLCVRGVSRYVDQGPHGTLILDEAAANVVPGCVLVHPSVAFHCPLRQCTRPHILDLDGPWYSTLDGVGAAVARSKAYIAAALPAIAISMAEHPMGTWTGALQKAIRRHLRNPRPPRPGAKPPR